MTEILLDFTGCKYIMKLHDIIKEGFNFPDWYGENLDAIWDLLRDVSGGPIIKVKIKGIKTMPEDLRDYMEEVLDVFEDIHKEIPEMNFEVIS